MFFDRVFGITSGVAFVLGLVCQIAWLTDLVEPSSLQWLSTIFFAFVIVGLVYMVVYVGRRDGFPYSVQSELYLQPVIRALPSWARIVTYGLFAIAAVFFVLVFISLFRADLLPGGSCVFESGSPETTRGATTTAGCLFPNLLMAAMMAAFGAIAFVQAVYLLRTSSPNA